MPRSQDLVIFMPTTTTTTTDIQTDYFTPCTCARGKIKRGGRDRPTAYTRLDPVRQDVVWPIRFVENVITSR